MANIYKIGTVIVCKGLFGLLFIGYYNQYGYV
ncbi:hypothetical protein QE422_003751 [Chryseobacterium sp. SORGH_AS 447]|nr:hypothetical protein [Chryseobacterium sp. SORGH_AS_0447]